MNQADQRAKDGEDKAIGAVRAIGVVTTPEQKKIKFSNHDVLPNQIGLQKFKIWMFFLFSW